MLGNANICQLLYLARMGVLRRKRYSFKCIRPTFFLISFRVYLNKRLIIYYLFTYKYKYYNQLPNIQIKKILTHRYPMTDYLQISTNFIPIPSAPKSQNINNQYNNSLQIINPQLTLHDLLISLDSNNLSHNNNKYHANITNSNSVNNLHYKYYHKITSSPYIHQQPQQQQQTKSIQKFYKNINNNNNKKYDNKYDNHSDQQIFEIIDQNKLLQLQMQQLMQQLNNQSKITQNIISQMNTNNNILIQYRSKCYHYQQIQNQFNKYRSEQLSSNQYSTNNNTNNTNNNGNLDKQSNNNHLVYQQQYNRVSKSPGITIPSRQSSIDRYKQTPIININLNRAINLSTKDTHQYTAVNHKQQQHNSINKIKKDLSNLKYKLNNPYSSKTTNPNNKHSNYIGINNTNDSINLSTKQYNSKSTKNTRNNQLDEQLDFIYDNNQPQHKQQYNNFNIHIFNKSISTDDSFQELFKKTIPVSMKNKSTQLLIKINQQVPKNMYKKITPTASWNNNNYIGCIDQNKSYLRKKLSEKCPNTVQIPQKNKILSKCSTPSKNQTVLHNYSYKADQNKYRKTKIFNQNNKHVYNSYQVEKINQKYRLTAFKIDVRACK